MWLGPGTPRQFKKLKLNFKVIEQQVHLSYCPLESSKITVKSILSTIKDDKATGLSNIQKLSYMPYAARKQPYRAENKKKYPVAAYHTGPKPTHQAIESNILEPTKRERESKVNKRELY